MSLDVTLTKVYRTELPGGGFEQYAEEVYEANITHNLGNMASEAGIYEAVWRPHRLKPDYNIPKDDHKAEWAFEDQSVTLAKDIAPIIEKGLDDMKARPDHYQQFNASNGWGLYKYFVPWLERYVEALNDYPDATVRVSR